MSGSVPAPPTDPSHDPRRVLVSKRRVRVAVAFATSTGSLETLEGRVAYRAGDAIVTGGAGERWPVPRATFFATYRPLVGGEGGRDGLYESLPQTSWAVHLDEAEGPLRVVTSTGSALLAQSGDWIVERRPGDLHVVNRDLFPSLYETCDATG